MTDRPPFLAPLSRRVDSLRHLRVPGRRPQKGVEATAAYQASRTRLVSPLMRRILLVNIYLDH